MFSFSDSILFSIELKPNKSMYDILDWWYCMPLQIGQYITFYSKESLEEPAKKFGVNLYSNHKDMHL
jgi:hypothetical protein